MFVGVRNLVTVVALVVMLIAVYRELRREGPSRVVALALASSIALVAGVAWFVFR